jgi:branched-chain amino acid aminotransferase
MSFANYNGKIAEAAALVLPLSNSAFRYGNGLFETMLVQNGHIRLAHAHWQRLFGGLAQLGFVVPPLFTPAMLQEQVLRTVRRNALSHLCRVRLQVFGGNGGIFGPEEPQLHYLIECYPLQQHDIELNINGLVLGIATGLAKSTDMLSTLKSASALVYAAAARQARQNKWNDALVLNQYGRIADSIVANVFWVEDNVIYTPPLSEGCIAGVMRGHLLATVNNIVEKPLDVAALANAGEVFLTNAIRGVRWVATVDDTRYTCGIAMHIASVVAQTDRE